MMPMTRAIPLLIVLVAIGSLASALVAEYVYRLEPCILCIYQRLPFIATGVLALLALKMERFPVAVIGIIAVCGLIYLAGSGIAFYHVGVEQHWWLSGCSGELFTGGSVADLRAGLMSKPEKPCDDIDWTLFGISMATYNVAYSGGLGLLSLGAAMQMSKTRKTP
jgi:disulfide bond formation protein DsbB